MIVCKFGGRATSSTRTIENIKKLKEQNSNRKVFVFSAIGKQSDDDEKLTDLLIKLANQIENDEVYHITQAKIGAKLSWLNAETEANVDTEQYLSDIIDIYKLTKDASFLISRGEYITTYMMSKFLDLKFVPAKRVIFFKNGNIDEEKTARHLKRVLSKNKKIIIPGFYGSDEHGKVVLLSRGGGDVTGALITKLLGAKIYENWTDVTGVMQVNPIVTRSKQIRKMNYLDLEFMTSFDAKVVHKDCAKILQDTGAKLKIGSIFDPKSTPTIVFKKCKEKNLYICYKENYDSVDIFVHNKNSTIETHHSSPNKLKETISDLYTLKKD